MPSRDPSLLFTNAGMVQFKDQFLGLSPPPGGNPRAVSVQRCVRAGGKHNDLDNVGMTPRHHTFFEMLGNFSFGDYFKEEAIAMAWQYISSTEYLGLPIDRLRVTVHENDQEAYDLWRKISCFPDDRILRLGDEDNFWSMGDVGPCGPCSEIFWDQGDHIANEEDRFLEIWNLVFMEYHRDASSPTLHPLPQPSVDTGMGLERIASVLQGQHSNYGTDEFVVIMNSIERLAAERSGRTIERFDGPCPAPDSDECALRVIADHLRASVHLVADGVVPSNVGRGYVLRRILRRALRYGHSIGLMDPFMAELVSVVTESSSIPDDVLAVVQSVVKNEESTFSETLERGLVLLDQELLVGKSPNKETARILSGDIAFKLYDTYGFPADLTELVARERGWSVNMDVFRQLMEEQRARARRSWQGDADIVPPSVAAWRQTESTAAENANFVGYDVSRLEIVTQINRVHWVEPSGDEERFVHLWVALDACPFYAEGGGQIADSGEVSCLPGPLEGISFDVVHAVQANNNGDIALLLQFNIVDGRSEWLLEDRVLQELFVPGCAVLARVDESARAASSAHHTATHLLNAALRDIVGDQIMQAGSSVEPGRLRFDFTHGAPLDECTVELIEEWVNASCALDRPVSTQEIPFEEAQSRGALAQFGEKYGDVVRVVDIPGLSTELCGGTHVASTGVLRPFKIISEGSAAAGVRRIEAVASDAAVAWYKSRSETLSSVAKSLKLSGGHAASTVDVQDRLTKLVEENKALKRHVEELRKGMLKFGAMTKTEDDKMMPTFELSSQAVYPTSDNIELEDSFHVAVHYINLPTSLSPEHATEKKEKKRRNQESIKALRELAEGEKASDPTVVHIASDGMRVIVMWPEELNWPRVTPPLQRANGLMQQLFAAHPGRGGGRGDFFAQGQFLEPLDVDGLYAVLELLD